MEHWFKLGTSVNQHVYKDMLQTVVWPRVKNVATRRQYWFQQDGATAHTTNLVLAFLQSKFGDRIISRRTETPWPAKSPDLSPLDYWFWSQCLAELRRNPTNNIQHQVLKNTINTFAETITNEQVLKAVSDITARARCCIQVNGGAFEYKLKKMKRRL